MLFLPALALSAGCSAVVSPGGIPDGGQCATAVSRFASSSVTKVDLLFAVSDERSMGDKQQMLALALPDLLGELVNPRCVDPLGGASSDQPAGPLDPCPAGSTREIAPILDLHVGIVSSDLGDLGTGACALDGNVACPGGAPSVGDLGHLITRTDPCGAVHAPTWQGQGFLAWDPAQALSPPGIADGSSLSATLANVVIGVGAEGCSFASQNEAWYRFLVDPSPWSTLQKGTGNQVQTEGVDATLLQQRADFLRPDSLLAIVVVSDRDDSSVKEFSEYPVIEEQAFQMPRPRQECAQNPADPCCLPCTGDQGTCPVDAECQKSPTLPAELDPYTLRRWDSKRRFGFEAYYTPDRYVSALTAATVTDASGKAVPNPIFTNLSAASSPDLAVRDPSLVFLAEIVGVPWQDIARQTAAGVPDLVAGLDLSGAPSGGYKSAAEMATKNAQGLSAWDIVLGDADFVTTYGQPADPLMIASPDPRTGTSPVTGVTLAPPTASAGGSAPNGHEYQTLAPDGPDLQYACIFPLAAPLDCSVPSPPPGCVCTAPGNTDPTCDVNPNDGGQRTLQTYGKAYPGRKELAIVKALGPQGIVGSLCPAQTSDPTQLSFGLRPTMRAVVERLRTGGDLPACWHTPEAVNAQGQVACRLVEARQVSAAACDCSGKSRSPVTAADACLVQNAQGEGWTCFCEIDQASGADLAACQGDASALPTAAPGQLANGWCFIDDTVQPPVGNPALVAQCPQGDERNFRLVGAAAPVAGAEVFMSCGP